MKAIKIIVPILLLALFIGVMTTGAIFKKPLNKREDVIHLLSKVENDVQNENWEQAKNHLSDTKKAWKRIVRRIQFSAERDEIRTIEKALERAKGSIEAEDKGGAMAELSEVRSIWEQLGK